MLDCRGHAVVLFSRHFLLPMTPVSHSPGPWRANHDFTIWQYEPDPIRRGTEPCIAKVFLDDEVMDAATRDANARLIAAAPELLDACKMLLRVLVQDCDAEAFGSEISHAEGVIAKAESPSL